MVERLIQPPNYATHEGPIIFLAGPIQGSPRWQDQAIRIIHNIDPNLMVASPRRDDDRMEEGFVYEEQVDWETHYLNRAAQNGAIMFWLARELNHQCDRAFAQTSRFELGEWKARHQKDGISLIVGIEDGFTNARYIKRRLTLDCPEVPILNSLDETCTVAVSAIHNQSTLDKGADPYSISEMPRKSELEDFLRRMFGQRAIHGGSVTFNTKTHLFERS